MPMLSYAEERAANMARNQQILASLGVEKLKPKTEPKETRHRNPKKAKPSTGTAGRKRKADADEYTDADADEGEDEDENPHAKRRARVANDENAIPSPGEPTEGRRRSSRIAGKPVDAIERVERSRGTPQPVSVKVLIEDRSGQVKRERRHNP